MHLRQLRFAQFLTDQVRDAVLANDNWDADENLVGDAVPAVRQRAEREHCPLYTQDTCMHSRQCCKQGFDRQDLTLKTNDLGDPMTPAVGFGLKN